MAAPASGESSAVAAAAAATASATTRFVVDGFLHIVPGDVQVEILGFLPIAHVMRLARVSKTFGGWSVLDTHGLRRGVMRCITSHRDLGEMVITHPSAPVVMSIKTHQALSVETLFAGARRCVLGKIEWRDAVHTLVPTMEKLSRLSICGQTLKDDGLAELLKRVAPTLKHTLQHFHVERMSGVDATFRAIAADYAENLVSFSSTYASGLRFSTFITLVRSMSALQSFTFEGQFGTIEDTTQHSDLVQRQASGEIVGALGRLEKLESLRVLFQSGYFSDNATFFSERFIADMLTMCSVAKRAGHSTVATSADVPTHSTSGAVDVVPFRPFGNLRHLTLFLSTANLARLAESPLASQLESLQLKNLVVHSAEQFADMERCIIPSLQKLSLDWASVTALNDVTPPQAACFMNYAHAQFKTLRELHFNRFVYSIPVVTAPRSSFWRRLASVSPLPNIKVLHVVNGGENDYSPAFIPICFPDLEELRLKSSVMDDPDGLVKFLLDKCKRLINLQVVKEDDYMAVRRNRPNTRERIVPSVPCTARLREMRAEQAASEAPEPPRKAAPKTRVGRPKKTTGESSEQ